METQKKCSYKKHENINAVSYCLECNVYMCNKCLNQHEFLDNHHKYNLDKDIQEIFTGKCKESNHNIELEFFCKTHNQLCCAACLSKIKEKGNGQHTDCDVCLIEDIKNEKKNKLSENIKYLEDFSNNLENSINELKKMIEEINKSKEELKMTISKIFTKIRNIINEREDLLLLEVDKKYDKSFFKDEEIIKLSDKLPSKIKISLEKGKLINNEWNDKDKLNSKINDCINIENNIKKIKEINESIKKYNSNSINIEFTPEEKDNEFNEFLENIKNFGEIFEVKEREKEELIFRFKPGTNYNLTNNGKVATKISGGDSWNCTIIGDKKIPENRISKWKIRINNFEIKSNTWNILIGIGPDNPNNENNYYTKCWSFICGFSQLSIKSGSEKGYNNHSGKLKKGDVIEVIVDRKTGNLSFSVNGTNYGIAYSQIPKNEELYPIVMINDQNQIVEIV